MPWPTITLSQLRQNARAYVLANLPGADAAIPNSNLAVITENNAGLCHLALQYLDWQSLQYLPITAEAEFLDRWAVMLLTNSDGSKGRKQAQYAQGTVTVTGAPNTIVDDGAESTGATSLPTYQTTEQVTIGPNGQATVTMICLTAGPSGNLLPGATFTLQPGITGTVVSMTGGTDVETDAELRVRVLDRLQKPPMGGSASDYVQWALAVPGVTRAWCSPKEMGIGTVTVRFMMDDLRSTGNPITNGFPLPIDVQTVQSYIDSVRPVTAIDAFVVAPIPYPVSCTLSNLVSNDPSTLQNIEDAVNAMMLEQGAPASSLNGLPVSPQTIYAVWMSNAILDADGVTSFDIEMDDAVMPNSGSLAVMGNIVLAAASQAQGRMTRRRYMKPPRGGVRGK